MGVTAVQRLVTAVLALVLVAGCGVVTPSPSPTPNASGNIVATGDAVMTSVARVPAEAAAAKAAAAGINALAADLYGQIAPKGANVVFSPYSIAVALAMTRIGAKGETATQMDKVLHAATVGPFDPAFNALDQALAKRPGTYPLGNEKVALELATANRLYGQRNFAFSPTFLDTLSGYYGAGVGIVDYIRATEAARKTINQWVSDRTKTRIPELIKQGMLDTLTRFVLVNAIYMKARWMLPFEAKNTTASPFHRLDGTDVTAQLMHGAVETYAYGKGSGYQAVRLPYVGGLSMVVILPDAGALATFESSLDGAKLAQITDGLSSRGVKVSLPKFTFRDPTLLKPALSALGMPIAFSDSADFSGISPEEPLQIAEVVHEAFIAVDEYGTEAAAATAVIGRASAAPSEPVEFTADHPFLFLIRDDETGAILFMGRVLDPTAQ